MHAAAVFGFAVADGEALHGEGARRDDQAGALSRAVDHRRGRVAALRAQHHVGRAHRQVVVVGARVGPAPHHNLAVVVVRVAQGLADRGVGRLGRPARSGAGAVGVHVDRGGRSGHERARQREEDQQGDSTGERVGHDDDGPMGGVKVNEDNRYGLGLSSCMPIEATAGKS